MQSDPKYLISRLDLDSPLIGVYDAPNPEDFSPVVTIPEKKRACVFEFYNQWMEGITLQLSRDSYGCRGCGSWWWGEKTRSREDYIDFLVGQEGLKADGELMGEWLDHIKPYQPHYPYLFVGPLKPHLYKYLKTITFYVNPDQLSILVTGAQYYHRPENEAPVVVEFGSGCMEMLTHIESKERPVAMVGATDMAMRDNLPADKLAFTVNLEMFGKLCSIGPGSFLDKPFLKALRKARGGSLSTPG